MVSEILLTVNEWSSIFWSFVQKELLYSSILFFIVLGFTRVLKKKSLYLQYGLWTLVLLRLVLPPDLSLQFSARSVLDTFGFTKTNVLEERLFSANLSQLPEPKIENRKQLSDDKQTATVQSEKASSPVQFSWQSTLFLIWLAGILGFVFIFSRRYFYYLQVIRKSSSVTDTNVLKFLDNWQKRFEIKRRVKLVSSAACLSPFTIGIFKPKVYLPETLIFKSNPQTIESVVAHELAHIKNYDDFWIRLQNFIQIVYFFHPVAWLANSRINQVRERICDDLVLSSGDISPKAYGSSMLTVLKMNLLGPEGVELLPSFGNHKKKFSVRIQDIVKISKIKKSNFLAINIALITLAVLLLPMAKSSTPDSRAQTITLQRLVNGEKDFKIHTAGAGSKFMKIASTEAEDIFCESKLPRHLKEMEYAAIGIYDTDYRKIWVLKGVNKKKHLEIYVDTNGDNCFTDEEPLELWKKTTKTHYEGSSEWSMNKYLKGKTFIDYQVISEGEKLTKKMAVYLIYYPEKNFLEFENNEFWFGKARFGDKKYPVALYGGLQDRWYLRPTFESKLEVQSNNEIRIDLNGNGYFEDMPIFDPTNNAVIQEKYFINEFLEFDGKQYEITFLKHRGDEIELQIMLRKAERT